MTIRQGEHFKIPVVQLQSIYESFLCSFTSFTVKYLLFLCFDALLEYVHDMAHFKLYNLTGPYSLEPRLVALSSANQRFLIPL